MLEFKKIKVVVRDQLDPNITRKIEKYAEHGNLESIPFREVTKKNFEAVDLVITLGGDGTFLKAANLIEDSFILGINADPSHSEGVLTSLTSYNLEELNRILVGDFEVIERQRAKVEINHITLEERALNEVYVGAEAQFHSSRYKIYFKDRVEEQRSSGVIASTGTGSSAWFLSAGGSIFDYGEEKISFIVREPYHGKRVFLPTILQGSIGRHEVLGIESRMDRNGIVSINDAVYPFNIGDRAEISLSDKPLRVITPKKLNNSGLKGLYGK